MGMKKSLKENLKSMDDSELKAAMHGYCHKHDEGETDKFDEFAAGLLFAEWLNRQGEQDSITGGEELDRLIRRSDIQNSQ